MKKLLLLLCVATMIVACSPQELKKQIKTKTTTEYYSNDGIKKDSISVKMAVGYYQSSAQAYFVGLIGFGDIDTLKMDDTPYEEKKDGNKTFYYQNGELAFIEVAKDNVLEYYDQADSDRPMEVVEYLSNKHQKIKSDLEGTVNKLNQYSDCVYDEFGNLTYAIITRQFHPNNVDSIMYSDLEISQKIVESRAKYIQEIEYEYY